MASDDDPMKYLNEKRQQMAAMAQMAEVSQMQVALAENVQSRMQKIESLLTNESSSPADSKGAEGDAEVEYWKRKVAELSAPLSSSANNNSDYGNRSGGGGNASVTPVTKAEEKLCWSGTASFADEQSPDAKDTATRRRNAPSRMRPDEKSSDRSTVLGIAGSRNNISRNEPSTRAAPKQLCSPKKTMPASKWAQETSPVPLEGIATKMQERGRQIVGRVVDESDGGVSGGEAGAVDGDAEVEYWRRKIAELSTPVPGASNATQSLHRPVRHLQSGLGKIGAPLYRSSGSAKATSLADQPLSWEGTSSFRDEQKRQDPRLSSEEILLLQRQEAKGD
jgi:hypothetical protein